MKKPSAQKLDPLKIYMNAERFRIADNQLRSTDPQVMNVVGLPTLVLCAFASELYLKCLLVVETGKAAPTHNLKALFRELAQLSQLGEKSQ
jgi:hypothetical protein